MTSPRDHMLKAKELRLRDKELALRERELGQKYWEPRFKSKAEFTDNGIRGLILINGGAVVALGAFLQAVISKPEGAPLVPFILTGLGLNGLGVASAAVIFWLRYMQTRHEDEKQRFTRKNPWWWAVWATSLLSILLFLFSIGTVVIGGFTHLKFAAHLTQVGRCDA
jgi:hypothetical protein